MELSPDRSARPEVVGVVLFLFTWLVCALAEYCLAQSDYGKWVELLNGATWPEYFTGVDHAEHRGFWFFVVLSLRTVLNLGITATAAYGVYFFAGPGRILMKSLRSALAIQNEALAAKILKVLEDNHTTLSDTAVNEVYKTVEQFSTSNYFHDEVLRAGERRNSSAA